MNTVDFYQKLNKYKYDLFLIDNQKIDPLEVIVITKHKNELLEVLGYDFEIGNGGSKRFVSIYSFNELGICNWDKKWKQKSKNIGDHLFSLSSEDLEFFFLYMALVYTETRNWVSNNIINIECEKYSINDTDYLNNILSEYVTNNGLSFKVRNIVSLSEELLSALDTKGKICYRFGQIIRKAIRKLTFTRLTFKSIFHRNFRQTSYINYLKKNEVLGNGWTKISNDGGSSSSTLIKIEEGLDTIFVKGNELPEYHSIKNEIRAQKLLQEQCSSEHWFLPMVDCDDKKLWIKYPYVKWDSLKKHFENCAISGADLEKLGAFLCECVHCMKRIGLVHNDLRSDNIMVVTDDNNVIERFVLTDFGCSTVNNRFPWKKNYWGFYMAKNVCGRYRYSSKVINDSASAYLVYLKYGGKRDDKYALELLECMKQDSLFFEIDSFRYGD